MRRPGVLADARDANERAIDRLSVFVPDRAAHGRIAELKAPRRDALIHELDPRLPEVTAALDAYDVRTGLDPAEREEPVGVGHGRRQLFGQQARFEAEPHPSALGQVDLGVRDRMAVRDHQAFDAAGFRPLLVRLGVRGVTVGPRGPERDDRVGGVRLERPRLAPAIAWRRRGERFQRDRRF